MSISELISVSRRYGGDPNYVVAGGGNTSWKTADSLYVKASGFALATIGEEGFVKMDRGLLGAIWGKAYPSDADQRESAVLEDMMAARSPGEESKRPSVETLLHDILPFAFVVHTHPALVNALTCSVEGEAGMKALFGEDALWIPSTNPGYILSKVVKEGMDRMKARTGKDSSIIFLQNHGLFVSADTVAGIDALYEKVFSALKARLADRGVSIPSFANPVSSFGPSGAATEALLEIAKGSLGEDAAVTFHRDDDIASIVADEDRFAPLASAYSPDHIVYAGSDPLFVAPTPDADAATLKKTLQTAWQAFVLAKGRTPKLVALKGVGIFGVGSSAKASGLAVELFQDAAKIGRGVEAFGGRRFMTEDQISFINNWEVERYRTKVSATK